MFLAPGPQGLHQTTPCIHESFDHFPPILYLCGMLKALIRPLYEWSHDWLNRTARHWPLIPGKYAGKPVGRGHISDEHLDDPTLDDALVAVFAAIGVPVRSFEISAAGYAKWLQQADYPPEYYGGGLDPSQNFTEKTLEHYVSTQFLTLDDGAVFVDIAACNSPFSSILARLFGCEAYQQDLIYPRGIHGRQIGGYAHELGLPDASVDAVTLHCSLEHFEGDSDTRFFQELQRVLRPGGRAVVLPFYLAHTYTIHVDPAYNLLKRHRPQLDPAAQLRYCDWYQYFSRHYDPAALQRRVLQAAPGLSLTLYRPVNFRAVHPGSYLRWIGVFEKPMPVR